MPQTVSKDNSSLRVSQISKNANRKLSFFHDVEESDSEDEESFSPIRPSVTSPTDDCKTNGSKSNRAGENLPASANQSLGHKLRPAREHSHLDNDNASSTGSCSCEDHSSVEDKSDDPHGDLDYDEDSITESPLYDNQRSTSVDESSTNQQANDTSSSKSYLAKVPTQEGPELATNGDDHSISSPDDKDEDHDASDCRNKLKSFIGTNNIGAEDESKDDVPAKDRSHKSYHGLLRYFFKNACFFQIKSINHENVEISKSRGVWSTQVQNEIRFNAAFRQHRNVILIFSVQQSGAFQGFARMTSEARPATRPIPWVLPERLNRANIGGVFQVEWLCTKELSFNDTRELQNPLNSNKPIKVARDGQQVESKVGRKLCSLFPRDDKKRLVAAVDCLKTQTRWRKQHSTANGAYYPMYDPRVFKSDRGSNVLHAQAALPTLMQPMENHATSQLHDYYDGQFYQPLAHPAYASVHERLGSRRRGLAGQFNAIRGPHPQHPIHFSHPLDSYHFPIETIANSNSRINGPASQTDHPHNNPHFIPELSPHDRIHPEHYYAAPHPHHLAMMSSAHGARHASKKQWSSGTNTARYHPYHRGGGVSGGGMIRR